MLLSWKYQTKVDYEHGINWGAINGLMAYLNANIPIIECWVRGNFLRDQKDSHDKYFEVGVFGFSSIPNRVPMFHFLMEDGGLWWRSTYLSFL